MTRQAIVVGTVALALVAGGAASSRAEVLMTEEKALERAFPGAVAERRTLYLTEEQVDAVQQEARSRLPSAIGYSLLDIEGPSN